MNPREDIRQNQLVCILYNWKLFSYYYVSCVAKWYVCHTDT